MDDDATTLPALLECLREAGYDVTFKLKNGEWAAVCDDPRRLTWGPTQYAATIAMMVALGWDLE